MALQKGAAHSLAVDVGRDQLNAKLKADARVSNFEELNARYITPDTFDRQIDALVCDVSFISLELALDSVLNLVVSGGWALALIKPQFEAGKSNLGKVAWLVTLTCVRKSVRVSRLGWARIRRAGWSMALSKARYRARKAMLNFLLARAKPNKNPRRSPNAGLMF